MTRLPACLPVLGFAVLAACAPQPPAGPQSAAGRECFHAGSVSSFHRELSVGCRIVMHLNG